MPHFTIPSIVAQSLMLPLPKVRPVAVDLCMGDGALLRACNPAEIALGVDADPRAARKPANAPGEWNCLAATLPQLYPLCTEVNWQADLFVLNPPFPEPWPTASLADLGASQVASVRESYAAQGDTIDSTLATYMIALDLMSNRGEGLLVCSEAVARRLFGDPDEPFTGAWGASNPRSHIWLWVTLPPGTLGDSNAFETAVLYFARAHASTFPFHLQFGKTNQRPLPENLLYLRNSNFCQRRGDSVNASFDGNRRTASLFSALKEEYGMRHGEKKRPWNACLSPTGVIVSRITDFQKQSWKLPRNRVDALLALNGHSPAGLAVQKSTRIELAQAVRCELWHVDPALIAAVDEAIESYNTFRAPLYPLNPMQRLGYLDEEESIECSVRGLNGFTPGKRYTLAHRPVLVEKKSSRINFIGDEEDLSISGEEICFMIWDDQDVQHDFLAPSQTEILPDVNELADCMHTLETLVTHFRIPEVPDVAALNPELYNGYVAKLHALEAQICA